MEVHKIREFLWPTQAEKDPGFRAEIERLGRRALRIIGIIEITMPILGAVAYHAFADHPAGLRTYLHTVVASIMLGVATRRSADTPWGSEWARPLALLSGFLSVVVAVWGELSLADAGLVPRMNGGMSILTVLLVGLAIVPMLPWQALVLGAASSLFYWQALRFALSRQWLTPGHIRVEELLSLPLVILLCTALAAVNYERLATTWKSHQGALLASEELRRAESRTLLAEGAAAMGRLAAAVSHELNSPLGAMRSSADTVRITARRLTAAEGTERERLTGLLRELSATIVSSADRMRDIVTRMQRFTNLDRSEVQTVDLNQLIADVSAIVSGRADGKVPITTEFGDLPGFRCHPQELSAVFSSLLHHAVDRAYPGGEVRIKTVFLGSQVEVFVTDTGVPLSALAISRMFDPEFRTSGGRVTTGDWNLFTTRRILQEAGGNIRADRGDGRGNTLVVSLLCSGTVA